MPQSIQSDDRLVARASKGDERALAAIFKRYHRDLFRYCAALLGNSEDAADALQNTMVKVLRALPGERRRLHLKPWLYRIAHNESIELLRKRQDVESIDAEEIVGDGEPEASAETRERLRQLLVDLHELPERQRGGLVMRELGGLSFEQIGAAFETSAAVARQTVYEARVGLQEMERGRAMGCDEVRRKLSDGDRRVFRRRDVRAHLRRCSECQQFEAAISRRHTDLAAISPLPALAAAGLLKGVLGGSAASAGGAGAVGGGTGAVGGALSGSVAIKAAATVVVAGAIGVGAADRTGVVPVFHDSGGTEKSTPAGGNGALDGEGAGDDGSKAGHPAAGGVGDRTGRKGESAAATPTQTPAAAGGKGGKTAPAPSGSSAQAGSKGKSHGQGSKSHGHGRPNGGGSGHGHGKARGKGAGSANAHGGNPHANGGNRGEASGTRQGGASGESGKQAPTKEPNVQAPPTQPKAPAKEPPANSPSQQLEELAVEQPSTQGMPEG